MPFVGNAQVREPFLIGAPSHTKEATFQKGSRSFHMFKRYDGSLLDHLAEYLIYLFTVSSFWSIQTIRYVPTGLRTPSCRSPPCSLSYKMGLLHQENELESLPRGPLIYDNQLHGHVWSWSKKLDLNACINGVSPKHRLKNHFIRIGILHHFLPEKLRCRNSDGRLIVTPPR